MFHAIKLSKTDPTPIYIQLASELAKLIQNGILPTSTKLPPIRFLSKQLMINRDTVVSAYKLLEHQGLVEAHVGKGTYVSSLKTSSSNLYETFEKNQIYCSHLSFPKHYFPIQSCHNITQKIIETEGWDAFNDPLHRERNLLRQSICTFFKTLNIPTTSAQVRVISSLPNFLQALFNCSPKKGVCVEAFRDLTLSSNLHSLGAKIYEVPLTKEGIDLEILEKHLRTGNIGFISVSPILQNPTGVSYSNENKQKLVELATLYDCYIIEDGTLSDFSYSSSVLPVYHHFCTHKIIYMYHFSKVYLPSFSYTLITLPSEMIRLIIDPLECSFNERFLRYYIDSLRFDSTKNALLEISQKKYQLAVSKLESLNMPLELYAQNGGLSLWLKPLTVSISELTQLLLQNNIVISPSTLFSSYTTSSYFRLSLSHLSLEQTLEVFNILHKLLEQKGS